MAAPFCFEPENKNVWARSGFMVVLYGYVLFQMVGSHIASDSDIGWLSVEFRMQSADLRSSWAISNTSTFIILHSTLCISQKCP